MTIRDAIKQAREEKGLTQKSVEKKTGISREYQSKFENNHLKNPTIGTLSTIAKGLGVKASELVAMTEK